MLILGVLDVGRGVLAVNTLNHAVREGARVGVVAYPASGWQTLATDRAGSSAFLLDPADLTLSAVSETDSGATFVAVSGQYRFHPIAPYITALLAELPLTTRTRMLAG
jgi:hypothetical protein